MLRGFVFLLVTTLLIVGAAFYLMRDPDAAQQTEQQVAAEQGFLKTEKDLNDSREEYERRKAELEVQISRMESREEDLATKFRMKRITKAQDIEKDKEAERLFKDIRQYRQDIKDFRSQIVDIDEAIAAIADALREIDRQKLRDNVGLSEEKQNRLQTIIRDLDDKFNKKDTTLQEMERQELLDEILGDEKTETKK